LTILRATGSMKTRKTRRFAAVRQIESGRSQLASRGTPHQVGKVGVHGRIVRELGMEGGDQDMSLAGHHAFPVVVDEGRHAWAEAADPRGPDEDHLDGPRPLPKIGGSLGLEALLLAPVGVALGRDVDEAQRELLRALDLPGEENEARAGAEDRASGIVELLQGWHELPRVHEVEEGRALAPRHDEAGDVAELLGQSYLGSLDADPIQRLAVHVEIALEGEHAQLHAAVPTLGRPALGRLRAS